MIFRTTNPIPAPGMSWFLNVKELLPAGHDSFEHSNGAHARAGRNSSPSLYQADSAESGGAIAPSDW